MPKISVLMPAFNSAEYIEESITSITNQTEKDFELIVVNDGSSDNTLSIIERLAAKDGRIQLINQKNSGIVSALNTAYLKCSGEFIARMDSDDISKPDRFEKQISVMKHDSDIVVCGSWVKTFGASNGLYKVPQTDAHCKSLLLVQSCFAHPSVMIRKKALLPGREMYESKFEYAEDYKLWSELANLGKFHNIAEPLLQYRLHKNQIRSNKQATQRNVHSAVSRENLQNIGITISHDEIHHMLWPEEKNLSKIRYAAKMNRLARNIFSKHQMTSPLFHRLLKLSVKNLIPRVE